MRTMGKALGAMLMLAGLVLPAAAQDRLDGGADGTAGEGTADGGSNPDGHDGGAELTVPFGHGPLCLLGDEMNVAANTIAPSTSSAQKTRMAMERRSRRLRARARPLSRT